MPNTDVSSAECGMAMQPSSSGIQADELGWRNQAPSGYAPGIHQGLGSLSSSIYPDQLDMKRRSEGDGSIEIRNHAVSLDICNGP
ncbi:hypothetical protein ON010_g4560 [Phytophthora cinnamomi]|nr:hypothetical protein ON010_g4560 [Phytophthora cinnamomi]